MRAEREFVVEPDYTIKGCILLLTVQYIKTKYIKIMEELLKRNRRNQEITQLVKKKSSGTFSATLFYKNFMILLEHTGGKLFFFFNCFPGSTNSITFGRGRLAFFSVQEPCKRKQYSQIYTWSQEEFPLNKIGINESRGT